MGQGACHCTDCQKAAGGGANYMVLAPKDAFKVTQGKTDSHTVTAESGNKTERVYCPSCGTPLWTKLAAPVVAIKAGALDDSSDFALQWHMYVSSAPAWHPMPEDVQRFEKMPPMGE